MVNGFYRIGQASKQLGISSYHLRRLCQAGAIEAELTSGNQWRVPISEVTRLEREGVPPIPQQLSHEEDQEEHPAARVPESFRAQVPEGLYTVPCEGLIDSAEEVTITENRLRKRRLEWELEEQEDFFRERAARQAAAETTRREAARKEQEALRRRKWENDWTTHALNLIPPDAPCELELEVHSHATNALSRLQIDHPTITVRRMVEAAAETALVPWRFQLQQQRAIKAALDSLPFKLQHQREFAEQKQEATRLATIAISQSPPGTAFL